MANKEKRKKAGKSSVVSQWVDVRTAEGRASTEYFPNNKDVELSRTKMNPQPTLIYRRLAFRSGMPREYFWLTPDAERRRSGGSCTLRLTLESWQFVMKVEAGRPDCPIIPMATSVPRPADRGDCDCPSCESGRKYDP